jgi:hypothetical protein
MKKSFITIALVSLFSVNAFAEFSLTCPEMYARTIISKERKKDKAGRLSYDLSVGAFITSFGGAAPVTVGLLLPAVALSIYSGADSREQKVMDLSEEGSRRLAKLEKKARKKINKDITQEEIAAIVEDGLVSGTFCRQFPHLYTPKEVKDYVMRSLKMKHSSAN